MILKCYHLIVMILIVLCTLLVNCLIKITVIYYFCLSTGCAYMKLMFLISFAIKVANLFLKQNNIDHEEVSACRPYGGFGFVCKLT